MSEESAPAPLDTEPPTASAAWSGKNGEQCARVPWADPTARQATGRDDAEARRRRVRQRQEEIAEADHQVALAERRARLAKAEQEAADCETRGRAKRIVIWLGVSTAFAAVLFAAAERIWEFFHSVGNFELVVSNATFVAGLAFTCMNQYLSGRFGRRMPIPKEPNSDSLDEAAASLSGEAEKLTRPPDDP